MAQAPNKITPLNYNSTTDRAEGLRAKLRELETAQALARTERDKASRANFDLKPHEGKLDSLAKEHSRIKDELDLLEGNPVVTPGAMSAPQTASQAENMTAIAQVQAAAESKPLPKPLKAPEAPAPLSTADAANKSFEESHAVIRAGTKAAEAGAIKQAVGNVVSNATDPTEAAANVRDAVEVAVAKDAETREQTGPDQVKRSPQDVPDQTLEVRGKATPKKPGEQ